MTLMPTPLTLPITAWGERSSRRRALLVHGLGSNGALMWRYGTALADAGWHAQAVDLRGHGTAPRSEDCTIAAYAADLGAIRSGRGWDLVVGHSLGGAAATVAASVDRRWARRLVLIDPAIVLAGSHRETIRASQARAFADTSVDAVRAQYPAWHPLDHELKALAAQQASDWSVLQTVEQNDPWDVRRALSRLRVPTHVIGADPRNGSIFSGALASSALRNRRISMSVVRGGSHSPHRDRPRETIRHLFANL